MSSLNPTMRVGAQLTEALLPLGLSRQEARQRALALFTEVGISSPAERLQQYPHELSGGMRQRVMIAIALACEPALLIADEPTTALDVTIQAQILRLMQQLNQKRGTSILLITHNLGIVAGLCQRILVMYGGQIIETGSVDQLFYHPQHPYTKALLGAAPRLGTQRQNKLATIVGSPPSLLHPPPGCPFSPRCRWAMEVCRQQRPPLEPVEEGQRAACWLHHPQAAERLAHFLSEPA